MRGILITAFLLVMPTVGMAQNQTPTSKQSFLFQPYMFGLGDGGGAYVSSALSQGYVVTRQEQAFATTTPSVGLPQMFAGLGSGYGLFMIASHGSTQGIAVEAYENTQNGMVARNFAFDAYFGSGWAGKIYAAASEDGFHIGAYAAAIGGSYVSANSIVYVLACDAHTWNGTGWPGSRCRLGYSGTCSQLTGGGEAITFWEKMKGNYGVANRTVDRAEDSLTLQRAGDGATTLTPWVKEFSHSSGTNIPGSLDIWWEFDTPTNQANNPIATTGIVQLVSYNWASSSVLNALVQSTGEGDGLVRAKGTVITSANTSQLLLNGGTNYEVRLTHSDNPAADVHGVTYRDGLVSFDVGSEPDTGPGATSHYEIEAGVNSAGPWTTVGTLAGGPGLKNIAIGSAGPLVRVVEIEKDGDRFVYGTARADAVGKVSLTPSPSEEACLEQYRQLKADRAASISARSVPFSGETVVAYAIPALVSVVQSEIATFWSLWGSTVVVVSTGTFPTDPDAFRNALKADIVNRVGAGTDAILLVGDANDHRQFTGPEYSSLWIPANGWESIRQAYLAGGYLNQASRDGIPTFYMPDTDPRSVNMGYVTPYWMSDWPYVDVDDDGLPDVPITRLPFTKTNEVYAYAEKLLANQVGNYGVETVGLFAGDVDQGGGEGADVLATMGTIAGVAAGNTLAWLYESDYPSIFQRNAAAATVWNNSRPEILFILGTLSNRSYPGGFFDQAVNPPFTMDYLSTHIGLVVALSCGGANFAQTEDVDYGRPVGERFVAAWSKGAVAWVGPTVGTWQHADDALAIAFAEELFEDFSRPIATSYLAALRRVLTDHAAEAEVVRSALSTVILGDPLVRVNRAGTATAIDDLPKNHAFALNQNVPNPFNPVTRISYSVPQAGQVSLRIYDVQGKLVATLVDRSVQAGQHSAVWDGRDDQGENVASGLFFYRLAAGGHMQSRKMLLLK